MIEMMEYKPTGMNIELTTCCPLRCPQCYCTLEGGKHIPLDIAKKALDEAAQLGVEHVELSGGETLCYPHLIELVAYARSQGIAPNVALSGWHFNDEVLAQLTEAGIEGIYISINGPTKELNDLSRDGFDLAISALETLKNAGFKRTYINWVMHRQTADYLPDMIDLAERYCVKCLVILMPKPDAHHELTSLPTVEQMEMAVDYAKRHKNTATSVGIENCFSQLLALYCRNPFWGNLNRGVDKGCGAGINALNVNVEGQYSPCRHLDLYEQFDTLQEYWENSTVLNKIRGLDKNAKEPCATCQFANYCRHCLAINHKLYGDLFIGNKHCAIKPNM